MRISCSVVCYNNDVRKIARVLSSVTSCGLNVQLHLIENSPTERTLEIARKFGACYVHLPANPGFGGGHNRAIRTALAEGSDYHLVLNPDIYFSANVIPTMIDYMERHAEIGLLSPQVCYPNGRPQYLCKLLPNPVDLIVRRFLPAFHRVTGRLSRYELHDSGYDKVMDVPAMSGCFMLIRTSVLRDTGLFDERFFLYFEDVDLTRRIGAVARTVYFPYVSIVHEYAKGSYQCMKLLICHIRSAIQYFNKWGWFVDAERKRINGASLERIKRIE